MGCDLIANISTVRVTKVNSCGAPISGATSGFTADCFSSLAMNVNIDEQDDVIYRAANGSLCGVKRGCPAFLGYDIEWNFYTVSPELTDVLTGNPIVMDQGGEPVGNDMCGINCTTGFAMEFWSELIQPCPVTGNKRYLYGLLPWITNAYINDLEIGSEAVSFQLVGSTRAGGQWGTGPYNVVNTGPGETIPGPMLTPLGSTCHRRMQLTQVAPPAAACDYTVVPVIP